MAMAAEAFALAEALGLRDRTVFFNLGWVPYAERGAYLLDADVAVSAHFDDIETRFSFRTRLLDCLWAGLPVVTTLGDSLGDQIVAGGAGRAVGFGDVAGWVDTLDAFLDDAAARDEARAAAAEIRPSFEWPLVVEPLRRLADPATTLAAAPGAGRAAAVEYIRLRLRIGYENHGFLGAARRLTQRAQARVRHVGARRAG